ncbi:MAG: hypothetical protein QM756_40685 [Polyangiaceae bacterium]
MSLFLDAEAGQERRITLAELAQAPARGEARTCWCASTPRSASTRATSAVCTMSTPAVILAKLAGCCNATAGALRYSPRARAAAWLYWQAIAQDQAQLDRTPGAQRGPTT